MGRDRMILHKQLLAICPNVYHQPPDNDKLQFPNIRYNILAIKGKAADDIQYLGHDVYRIQVSDKNPDSELWRDVLALPLTEFKNFLPVKGVNQWTLNHYH